MSAGSQPQAEADEKTVDDLVDALEEAEARLDAQSKQIDSLWEKLDDEREQRRELEGELNERDQVIDELRREISRLDERTDLLELVDDAEELDGEQRAAVLIQHLHAEARSRERRGEDPSAKIDRDGAEAALHYPSELDRTTFYKDMDRAARLVGDEDILTYEDGWLTLDLTAGSLPSRFTGSPEVGNL